MTQAHSLSNARTDIWIIDDNEHYCDQLTSALSRCRLVRNVVCHYTFESALEELSKRSENPGMILLNVYLPRTSRKKALSRLRRLAPDAKIILLTGFKQEIAAMKARKSGVTGYLPRVSPVQQIMKVVRASLGGSKPGETFMISRILSMDYWLQSERKDLGLSRREKDILRHLSRGVTPQDIASDLGLRPATIRSHIRNIHKKLQAHWSTEEFLRAFVVKLGITRKK